MPRPGLAALVPVLLSLLSPPPAPADAVDDLVAGYLREEALPGLSLAVVCDGDIAREAAYGEADVELGCPATVDTVYEIGSITKTFTATLVMMLVEEGAIDLDAPICRYLDDLPDAWEAVTVRHLLTHTSGIRNYTAAIPFVRLAREVHTAREILDLVAGTPLEFEPGTKWKYCNTGYYLLGLIVEEITGQDFARVLDRRILGPLGMTRTRPSNPEAITPGRASGYGKVLGLVRVNRDPITPSVAFAAGFLVSTVGDLAKWDAALRAGKLLEPASFARMYAPVALADGSTHPYGFGWVTYRRAGHRNLQHAGGTAGFSSILSRYPDDGLTIILLCNQADADLGTLERRLARHYLPGLDVAAARPIDDPEPEVTAHVRDAVAGLLADRLDRSAFTPELADHLTSGAGRSVARSVAAVGDLESFVLIGREARGGGFSLRYRAEVGDSVYLFTIHRDADGRIEGLWVEPTD